MNAGELREALKDAPDDMLVLVASDSEGNSFHEATGAWEYAYQDDEYEYSILNEEDEEDDDPRCMVIWP